MATAAYVVAAVTGVAGAEMSREATASQKKAAKKSERSSVLAQQEEQKKALARQNAQQQGGYGSTLGAGSSSLGG